MTTLRERTPLLTTTQAINYVRTNHHKAVAADWMAHHRRNGSGPAWVNLSARTIRYHQADLDDWFTDHKPP